MTIHSLQIQHIRNLEQVSLNHCARINVFTGTNGSGKTSLLEAIHLLGRGRSFRSAKPGPVIHHLAARCIIYGKTIQPDGRLVTAGVMRARSGEQVFKINGGPVFTASRLADILPLQLINADTFSLLEGGPSARRQFLDWGVFHVEHLFLGSWRRIQRSLKHRNALLRRGRITEVEMAPWEAELASHAETVDSMRSHYVARLQPLFLATLGRLLDAEGFQLTYRRGWPEAQSLLSLLRNDRQRDEHSGTTLHGPHRADLDIRLSGRPAEEVLSRGQEKLLVYALRIAQGQLLHQLTGKTCVYLVDDLPAELDLAHRQQLCRELGAIQSQIFVTATDPDSFAGCWSPHSDVQWFHVEHGQITERAAPSGL